jgi:hypothetical protein
LVVFITIGVVGMFALGLIKSRRAVAAACADPAQVTADKQDPVRNWLANRGQRVRSVLVFAARFPCVVAPVLGAAVRPDPNCTGSGGQRADVEVPGRRWQSGTLSTQPVHNPATAPHRSRSSSLSAGLDVVLPSHTERPCRGIARRHGGWHLGSLAELITGVSLCAGLRSRP